MCYESRSSSGTSGTSSTSSTPNTSSSRPPPRITPDRSTVCRYNSPYYWYEKRLKVVNMGYSDFDLQIDNTVFKTHRHYLVKFRSFAGRIGHASWRYTDIDPLKCDGTQQDADDMANAFEIIYASVLFGPFTFEPPVLISASRAAKKYGHPELRTYCIERLEECEADLSPMRRIELARAVDPDSREVATYDEMCKRDKPFTDAEMKILGMLAWSMVTRVRRLERAKSESESVSKEEEVECEYKDHTTESCEQELPIIPEVPRCGWRDEGGAQREKEEVMNPSKKRDELERMELDKRKKGYEEALWQHQERKKKEELKLKGKGYRRQEEQEHEWEGQEQEWNLKVGETSNLPMKGKNNGASRAFSAFSSRYLAMAGRICGKPKAPMDSPKPGGIHTPDAKDDLTLFDEYVDDFKPDDDSELHENKLSI